MVNKRTIQVRLTNDEYDRINANAQAKGFTFLSNYIRYVALTQDLVMQERIQQIHQQLLGEPKRKRLKKDEECLPFL